MLDIEEAAFRGRTKNERKTRIIHSLRENFRLTDILETLRFPKATYMYLQKSFERKNPIEIFEKAIQLIREEHPNYGYRRMTQELKRRGLKANKKKVQ